MGHYPDKGEGGDSVLDRRRLGDLSADADASRLSAAPVPEAVLVRTYTAGTYPTVARSYYACHPVRLGGTETEGGTGSLTVVATQTVYVFNLGASIPPTGTDLVATPSGGRLVAQYG